VIQRPRKEIKAKIKRKKMSRPTGQGEASLFTSPPQNPWNLVKIEFDQKISGKKGA
jgi:hypothetical protein